MKARTRRHSPPGHLRDNATMTPPQPTQRIILLGASNLTRGLSIVVETARLLLPGQRLDILAALGHGRAYGLSSRVLVRSLPSILDCGLWHAMPPAPGSGKRLNSNRATPPVALITDIGNDIIYGLPPEEAARCIGECIDRLQKLDARIIITQLPIASLRAVPRWRFEVVRALLYPAHHLSFEDAIAQSEELNARLCDLAREHGIPAIEMDRAWYGLDPIHIQRGRLAEAWAQILSPPEPPPEPPEVAPGMGADVPPAMPPAVRAAGSLRRWLIVRRAMPETWRLLGRERRTRQPAARLPDGTLLSLY